MNCYFFTILNQKIIKHAIIFFKDRSRTTISLDVQTRFPVQLVFAKFLSKIKENFEYSASSMDTALPQKFPFFIDRNFAKAYSTGNRVCTSCDTVVLGIDTYQFDV